MRSGSGSSSTGVENIENVNAALQSATPWYPIYGVSA